MKKFYLLTTFLIFFLNVFAQNVVKGKITDAQTLEQVKKLVASLIKTISGKTSF